MLWVRGTDHYLELLQYILPEVSNFQQRIMRNAKKQESVTHAQEKSKQQKLPIRGHICQLSKWRLQTCYYKEPKETMLHDLKEDIMQCLMKQR